MKRLLTKNGITKQTKTKGECVATYCGLLQLIYRAVVKQTKIL